MKKKSFEDIILSIKEKLSEEDFNNLEFDKNSYVNYQTPIRVFCKKHKMWFNKRICKIKEGQFCEACCYEHIHKRPYEDRNKSFEELAREVHGDKYDYLGFDEEEKKYIMFCHEKDEDGNEHGEFKQTKTHHLSGEGCPKCRYIKSSKTKSNSLEKLKEDIEKNKERLKNYTFDFDSYKNYKTNIKAYCHVLDEDGNEHGEFKITPNNLFHKTKPQGCPKCGLIKCAESRKMSAEEFIERANIIHNKKYIYKEEDYIDYGIDMRIYCPIHGYFNQQPRNHLQGQGCPICKESKLEKEIAAFLEKNNIEYIRFKTFDWLINKRKLILDFYLPKYNVAIECQGKQHFIIGGWNNGEDEFKETISRDKIKKDLCDENNVRLLYYSNLGIEYPYKVFEDKELLLKEIIEYNGKEENK